MILQRTSVRRRQSAPQRARPERFRRDVFRATLTSDEAAQFDNAGTVATVMVGELWAKQPRR